MRATAAESMRLAEIAIALKAVASTEGHLPAAHSRLRSISRQRPQTSDLAPLPLCESSLRQTDSPPCRVTTPALRARRLSIPPLGPPPRLVISAALSSTHKVPRLRQSRLSIPKSSASCRRPKKHGQAICLLRPAPENDPRCRTRRQRLSSSAPPPPTGQADSPPIDSSVAAVTLQ